MSERTRAELDLAINLRHTTNFAQSFVLEALDDPYLSYELSGNYRLPVDLQNTLLDQCDKSITLKVGERSKDEAVIERCYSFLADGNSKLDLYLLAKNPHCPARIVLRFFDQLAFRQKLVIVCLTKSLELLQWALSRPQDGLANAVALNDEITKDMARALSYDKDPEVHDSLKANQKFEELVDSSFAARYLHLHPDASLTNDLDPAVLDILSGSWEGSIDSLLEATKSLGEESQEEFRTLGRAPKG